MSKVRQEVGAENARVRVPAGAPQRTSADLSALSAREKIRFGMGNQALKNESGKIKLS